VFSWMHFDIENQWMESIVKNEGDSMVKQKKEFMATESILCQNQRCCLMD
jgi:hypothetical protein